MARPKRAFITDAICAEVYRLSQTGICRPELAARHGVSRTTIRTWIKAGEKHADLRRAEIALKDYMRHGGATLEDLKRELGLSD